MKLAVSGVVAQTNPIEGADLIQQAVVDCGDEGVWSGVVGKDMKVNDPVVVFMQDAILPPSDRWAFMERHKWRVRMARFKGVPSECVIVPAVGDVESDCEIGFGLDELLGVTKYEKKMPAVIAGDAKGNFPSFIPKTDEPNFQRVRDLPDLLDGIDWYAAEKADGTSCTVWVDDDGMHVCSRNLELKEFAADGRGNVYWETARKYNLERLQQGVALQFEIVGPGIQGNPMGLEQVEMRAFTLYHIKGRYRLPFAALVAVCNHNGWPLAKVLGAGFGFLGYDELRSMADEHTYANGKPAEGIVIRDVGTLGISFKVISLNYKD